MNNVLHGLCTFVMIACSLGNAMERQESKISVRQLIVTGCKEKKPLTQERLLSYATTLDVTHEITQLKTETIPERIRMHAEPLGTFIKDTRAILTQEEANLDNDKPRSWAPYTLAAAAVCCGLHVLKTRFCISSGDEPCEKMALFLGGLGVAEWKASREECKHTQEERIGIQNGLTLVKLVELKTSATLQEKIKEVARTKLATILLQQIQETKAQSSGATLTTALLKKELSIKVEELQTRFREHITVEEANDILEQVLQQEMPDEELDALLEKADQEIDDTKTEDTKTLEEKKNQ